jgi:hypothetical protein
MVWKAILWLFLIIFAMSGAKAQEHFHPPQDAELHAKFYSTWNSTAHGICLMVGNRVRTPAAICRTPPEAIETAIDATATATCARRCGRRS